MGFYTRFSMSENVEKIANGPFFIENIGTLVNGKKADFMLFVCNGLIACLEGRMRIGDDNDWPNVITSYGFYDRVTGKIIETYGND